MLNLAIGWAFLISFMWSPGGKLLSAIIEPTVFRTLPPYQGVLAGVFANYWMPALVIYVVLNLLRAGRFLSQAPASTSCLESVTSSCACMHCCVCSHRR